jgi:hypothetical protein
MSNIHPQQNAPVTAASIVAAVALVLAAFTELSAEQVAAVNAVVGIVAAILVQRFHTDPKGT